MKRIFKCCLLLIIGIIFSYLSISIFKIVREKRSGNKRIEVAPSRSEIKWIINFKPFKRDYLIIILFHPDCEHCQRLIQNISKKYKEFEKSAFWFISFSSRDELNQFREKYISESIEYNLGLIPVEKVDKIFLGNVIPQVFVYDHNLKLKSKFLGEPNINFLIQINK